MYVKNAGINIKGGNTDFWSRIKITNEKLVCFKIFFYVKGGTLKVSGAVLVVPASVLP